MELYLPPTPSATLPETIDADLICTRLIPVSTRTLWRWIAAGTFPKPDLRIGHKVRLWRLETVRAWIDRQTAGEVP
jgi:predicted DNA-binding transcriptional regulator AlpA